MKGNYLLPGLFVSIMDSDVVPEGRCRFVLEPGDVAGDRAEGYEAESDSWYEFSNAVCCWRPVWGEADDNRCIWHTRTTRKSVAELIESKANEPERLDGTYIPAVRLGDAIDFDKCWLTAAIFAGTHLQGASFKQINGRYIQFPDTDLSNAQFHSADLRGAQFSEAGLRDTQFHATNLLNAQFHDSLLPRAQFDTANLRGAQFDDADLRRARFPKAQLSNAEFPDADLRNAEFPEADLRGARLYGADLRFADFTGADLRNAELDNTVTEDVDFEDALVSDPESSEATEEVDDGLGQKVKNGVADYGPIIAVLLDRVLEAQDTDGRESEDDSEEEADEDEDSDESNQSQ